MCGHCRECAPSLWNSEGRASAPSTSGDFWGGWDSVPNARRAEPANATRRPLLPGNPKNGLGLKKSPERAAHHRLYRRERSERAAAPSALLGAERSDAHPRVQLQLAALVGDRRPHRPLLLLPPARRRDSHYSGHRLPRPIATILAGKLLIIGDRAQIHRSLLVRRHVDRHRDRLAVANLPANAPELNPVEYLWGYWKQNELANFCAKDIWQLGHFASQALKRIRRRTNRPTLIAAFWKQAEVL